jgi:hypothetical protein
MNIATSDSPVQLAAASEPAKRSTPGHFVNHIQVILPSLHSLALFFRALGGMLMILAPAVVRLILFPIVFHAAQSHNQRLSQKVARYCPPPLAIFLDIVNVDLVRVAGNQILHKARREGDGETDVANDGGAGTGPGRGAEALPGQHRSELEAADLIGDAEGVEVKQTTKDSAALLE